MVQVPASQRAGRRSGEVTPWVGWIFLAGILMLVSGFFTVVEGVVALLDTGYYRVPATGLAIEAGYTAWGWLLLVLGMVLMAAGVGVMFGKTWARVVAVIVSVINVLTNVAFVPAEPFWAVLVIAINVLVIYSLVVHGREPRAMSTM